MRQSLPDRQLYFAGLSESSTAKRNPPQAETRRIKAICGAAFSLVSFFWPNKRKKLGCRAETRLQKQASRSVSLNLNLSFSEQEYRHDQLRTTTTNRLQHPLGNPE